MTTPAVESFCRSVELHLVRRGGFARITGEPGTGWSVALRLLAQRYERPRSSGENAIPRKMASLLLARWMLVI